MSAPIDTTAIRLEGNMVFYRDRPVGRIIDTGRRWNQDCDTICQVNREFYYTISAATIALVTAAQREGKL